MTHIHQVNPSVTYSLVERGEHNPTHSSVYSIKVLRSFFYFFCSEKNEMKVRATVISFRIFIVRNQHRCSEVQIKFYFYSLVLWLIVFTHTIYA